MLRVRQPAIKSAVTTFKAYLIKQQANLIGGIMYPRNAASPPRISVGAVVQISDGAVQTAGVSIVVRPEGGAETAGAGTLSYGATSGIVYYTPTQAETDYTAFVVVAYKTGCIPAEKAVITSASATAGHAGTDQSKIVNPTAVVNLTGTSIKNATDNASQTSVDGKPTLVQIEASSVLAKEATVNTRASQTSVNGIPTNPLLTTDSRLNNLDFAISTVNNNILNLNNLSAKMNLFGSPLLEIPESGSTVYAFTLVVKDDEDKLVNLDASPTVTAANAAGTNRSANLSAVSNPSTGRYTFTYTVANTHAAESLRIAVSGAVSAEARYVEWIGAVVNYDTLTVLQQISTDLAGKPNLAQIEASTILAKDSTVAKETTLSNRPTLTQIESSSILAKEATVASRPVLTQIEASTVLAKESTVANRASQSSVDSKPSLIQIEASSVLAKEQSVSSLSDRIGAFAGSGANTVLGFFRALMRKDAGVSIPTDVGGTYSNATDSLEAIRDRGDEAWITGSGGGGGGGIGTGARSVSITVTDQSATPVQSATVRVSRSGQTFAVQTNASGVALFSLDDATWTVSITTPGYSFAPVSLIVAGNVNQTYSMTQITPTPPAPFAGLCNVQFSVIHLGLPVANATVVALLEDENPTVNNYLVSRQITSGSTDLNGNCVLTLVQYAQFTRGGVYRIKVADFQGKTIHDRRVTIPSTSTANAEDLQDAR